MNNKTLGIIYAVSSAISFGFVPVFAVIAYNAGTNAVTVLFFRFLIASLVLAGVLRWRKVELKVSRKLFCRLAYLGIAGYAVTCITLFVSYSYISTGLAMTLHFIYPAVVAVLSFFIFKEKMSVSKIFALAVSIIGVYMLAGGMGSSVNLKGVALALASGILYSLYTIEIGKEELMAMDGLLLTFYVSFFSAVSILIFGALTRNLIFVPKLHAVLGILSLALVCTVLGILAYNKSIQMIGPTYAAVFSTVAPITSVIMGIIVFNESLSLRSAIGSIMVISSVLIFSYNKNDNTQENKASDISQNLE
ncbi:MAG: DMT family transporter [Gracilibacteraceae bacterium]|nr:DMT family transporter [Gracilibacteraceae bacterium]